MLNAIRKDHNRRSLVKKFEIYRLQNKILSRAILLLDSPFLQYKNNRLNDHTGKNEESDLSFKRIDPLQEKVKHSWKKQILRSTPRNSSRVRIRNRCIESGRPRAVLKFCKLSRIRLRLKGSQGLIPGLRKSSW